MGTSREKLHQDMGLQSLQLRRWYREFCCFVKIYSSNHRDYFLIPTLRDHRRQKFFIIFFNSKWNLTFSKTHLINKRATSLLIWWYDINQIFYSNVFLYLFSSRYLLFHRMYGINIYVPRDCVCNICVIFYVLCV